MARAWQGPAGCGTIVVGIVVSSGLATLMLTLPGGRLGLFPFVLFGVLAAMTIVGMPIYITALDMGIAGWRAAASGGFITGALLPAVTMLSVGSIANLAETVVLGAAGAVTGMVFWMIVRPRREIETG